MSFAAASGDGTYIAQEKRAALSDRASERGRKRELSEVRCSLYCVLLFCVCLRGVSTWGAPYNAVVRSSSQAQPRASHGASHAAAARPRHGAHGRVGRGRPEVGSLANAPELI